MIRQALISLATAAAACKGEAPAPGSPGPAYTPATADLLKALAAECELRGGPDGETRACRGRQATMRIELDRARRIRELDITVLAASGIWEAWTLYENVLPGVAGQAVTDVARRKLRGDPADDVEGVRVAATASGERYSVKLTWGR
jgi:hypothetical protein